MAMAKKIALFGEIGVIKSANDLIGADMSDTMKAILFYGMAMFFAVEVLVGVLK